MPKWKVEQTLGNFVGHIHFQVRDTDGKVIGEAVLEHCKKNRVEFTHFLVNRKYRGEGIGHAILTKMCKWLDKHNATCESYVSEFDNGDMDNGVLMAWYMQFGFVCTNKFNLTILRKPK